MGVASDGWLTWAERCPGPPDKVYSEPNGAVGYVPHSAVSYYCGWLSRLISQQRPPDGRYTEYAAVSVHGFIFYDGRVVQPYPFTASCWASGRWHANAHFVAFENEGGYEAHDEPLAAPQFDANLRIIRELSEWKGWTPRRPASERHQTATLYEHNECVRICDGGPTAGPSNRIPWDALLDTLEDEMTLRDEFERLKSDFEAFRTMTQAMVKGQADFDRYTAEVFRRHVREHPGRATLAADAAELKDRLDSVAGQVQEDR